MGIETAFAALASSLGTAGAVGATLAGGALLGKAVSSKPKMPALPAPEKPPQATKAPDRQAVVAGNAAAAGPGGALAGNSSTFLTGPAGIDPSTLNLGKNTLLGQ